MSLRVSIDANGALSICSGRNVEVIDLRVVLGSIDGSQSEKSLRASPWESSQGSGVREARWFFSCDLSDLAGPVARCSVNQRDSLAWVTVETLRDLDGLAMADSFEISSIAAPAFAIPSATRALAVTYGLGSSGAGETGGYWPKATTADAGHLPCEAFAPLILYDDESALAIAPASHFLTSAMLRTENGAARTLHGAVDCLPAGTRLETVFAAGRDVGEALAKLGDALLARSGKTRPAPGDSLLTSTLGWWNAYGGYYTEPIRPLGENRLIDVVERLRRDAVPIAYVGLDLWYPYEVIGQALRFSPDPKKYARGLREIGRRHALEFVFHLSALSRDNAYAASGADPAFYADVASELRQQGGIAAWHDWLRTQQHLTPSLRADPAAAERWFGGMATALEGEGLALLLCMQTMGMVLAATALPNAIAARTAIDYLFGQPEALETLASLGHSGFRNDATALGDLRRQNLLVGSVLHGLGLLPFHDLFLTTRHEALGGAAPRTEAVLRALSCGPIGIGDGPGMTDIELVRSLVSARGALLQPDHAPHPVSRTLGDEVEVYKTERVAGSERWEYMLAINNGHRPASFAWPHDSTEVAVWDGLGRRMVGAAETRLAPGDIAYFVFVPLRAGIAPLGLVDKLVPAPASVVRSAECRNGWRIELDAPGERFAFACSDAPRVAAEDGRELPVRGKVGLWTVEVPESVSWLVATRR